ncbi:Protein SHORT-ROOT [Morella rubra]|uniref:Protein SHORT-ROOT n=1 Tax=Morella rubra TaxID=262757 RepID=A0A6A1VJZ1_9ROSI|nr:Protein SHORT-ROOT [Morella rubra]
MDTTLFIPKETPFFQYSNLLQNDDQAATDMQRTISSRIATRQQADQPTPMSCLAHRALFCKATESGQRCYKTLTSVAEKSQSFDSARKLILKFQEGALRRVEVEERGAVIRMLQSLRPRVVTVVEEQADFSSSRVHHDFVKCFEECLRFYTLYFEMLEESFVPTSNDRLKLERECLRSIIRVFACDDENGDQGECESRERGGQWSERLKEAFSPARFSDDVLDDVKALLKRYRAGRWTLGLPQGDETGIYLTWKEEPVIWASAWKPYNDTCSKDHC